MKTLKKALMLIMMMILIVSLSGCEGDDKTTTNNTSKNQSMKKIDTSSVEDKEETNATETNNTVENPKEEKEEIDVASIDFLSAAKKQVANPQKGETIAIFHIKNYGDIKVKLFPEVAPKAVENFVTHAKNGYYNGLIFHRVINDFMIQGGDPTGTGTGGTSIWGKNFEDEFSYDLVPYRGALCMANAGANTNGSQFFIEQAKYDESTATMLKQYGYPENILNAYKEYGGSMHLFGAHTVFGQVIEGMDVVDKIAATKVDSSDKPVEDVVIESIEITQY